MTASPRDDNIDPDFPVDPVPQSSRQSAFSLLVILLGFVFFIPTMLAGAEIGEDAGFSKFLIVITLGSLILGVYVAILGAIGARTALTTVMMGRYSFGNIGAKGASLLLGGTQVGWYGVAVATLAELTAQAFGWESQWVLWLLMVAGGILMGIPAYYGYRGMYWLSVVAIVPMFVLAFWVVARSVNEVGGWSEMIAQEGTGNLSVAAAITIVVGTFASGGTQVPNWTRFGRTATQAFFATLAAFMVGNLLMLFFGGIGSVAFGEGDFVQVLYQLGLVVIGLLFLLGALWTTNDNAAYAFGMAGAEIFGKADKRPFIIGGVAIGTLLALTGIYSWLATYLTLLGVLIPPVGGVIIGDWLRLWRRGMPHPSTYAFAQIRVGNVLAYGVGALVAWLSEEFHWGIAPVNGIVVAILGVWIFGAFTRDVTRAVPTEEQADHRGEETV